MSWLGSRSPRGERGLKSRLESLQVSNKLSLPSRGAWIEIVSDLYDKYHLIRRSPRGERGLKCLGIVNEPLNDSGRSPRGERGLKLKALLLLTRLSRVAPLAGSVD